MCGGVKRKYPVDKKLIIFTNCLNGKRCASLYEIKISIKRYGDDRFNFKSDYCKGDTLKAVETFYDHRPRPSINSVSACLLDSRLFLMPDGSELADPSHPDHYPFMSKQDQCLLLQERQTLLPCFFDLNAKETPAFIRCYPLARKYNPIVTAINGKVFALSNITYFSQISDSCFELLDLYTCTWSKLEFPLFHQNNKDIDDDLLDIYTCTWEKLESHLNNKDTLSSFNDPNYVTGFVTLEEQGFILVSVIRRKIPSYYSYHIHSAKWAHVPVITMNASDSNTDDSDTDVDDDPFIPPHFIHGEAVVVGNYIYTYFSTYMTLLSISFCAFNDDETGDPRLSLGPVRVVQGLKFADVSYRPSGDHDDGFHRTGTVSKVVDEILCVLHTMCPDLCEVQLVCVTFILLVGRGNCCNTLESFTCTLLNGTDRAEQTIKSCFVLDDLEEKSEDHPGKRSVQSFDGS